MTLNAGVARTRLTPFAGVELAGCGYFTERVWTAVDHDLSATAVVLSQGDTTVAIVSADLFRVGAEFVAAVASQLDPALQLSAEQLLIVPTGTTGAPTTGNCLGFGEIDEFYSQWASRQLATAIAQAARSQQPVTARAGATRVASLLRSQDGVAGGVDSTLTTLWLQTTAGTPLVVLFNFPWPVSDVTADLRTRVHRDRAGRVCSLLESTLPGLSAVFLPAGADDVAVAIPSSADFPEAELSLTAAVLGSAARSEPLRDAALQCQRQNVHLSTRRWKQPEIDVARNESQRRLKSVDASGWQNTLGKTLGVTPADVPLHYENDEWLAVRAMCRFQLGWTFPALQELDTRPEFLSTALQHIRLGPLSLLASSVGLFGKLALDIRQRSGDAPTMLVSYANGFAGPLPDAESIQRQHRLAVQGPKLCNQFPFTPDAGKQLCDAMVQAIRGAAQ